MKECHLISHFINFTKKKQAEMLSEAHMWRRFFLVMFTWDMFVTLTSMLIKLFCCLSFYIFKIFFKAHIKFQSPSSLTFSISWCWVILDSIKAFAELLVNWKGPTSSSRRIERFQFYCFKLDILLTKID